MNSRELAWAAGIFEGEGCFTSVAMSTRGRRGARASVSMADEDTVRRFGAAVGVGRVYGPYERRIPGRKPLWQWRASRFAEVQHVVCLMWYGLGARRRARAAEVLAECRTQGMAHFRFFGRHRKTHCNQGHAFTPENTYWSHDRLRRWCRTCNRRHVQNCRDRERSHAAPENEKCLHPEGGG